MRRAVFKRWYEDTPGGKYGRRVGEGRYHVIEWTDMDDACGRDNEGRPRYHCGLSEVDVLATGEAQMEQAKRSCGWEGMVVTHEALAECLHSYGLHAPLWDDTGGDLRKLMRAARRESAEITSDPERYEEAMSRTVNKLGSTAREFMQGDLHSAMVRGVRAGDTGAMIMAKMHGATEESIEAVRRSSDPGMVSMNVNLRHVTREVGTDDPLPYVMGFMRALSGRELEAERKELSPWYIKGYQKGIDVRSGACQKPDWAK